MKNIARISFCVLATTCGFTAMAATPSVNGALTTGQSPLVDTQGNSWNIVGGVIEENGGRAGASANVNMLLLYNQAFYQRNTSNAFYKWNGSSSWDRTTDPRVVSTSGAKVAVGTSVLVDATQHVWTLPQSEHGYRDGAWAAGNYNTVELAYVDGVIYSENTGNAWYAWQNSNWTRVSGDPTGGGGGGGGNPPVTSASGTKIGVGSAQLVDSGAHVWTLPTSEIATVDGVHAASNHNTIEVLYYLEKIYSENTSNEWYSWSGSNWDSVPGDPTTNNTKVPSANGASIGVGTASLVDSGLNVWTLLTNEYAYRNGVRAATNSDTISLLYYNGLIYSENTSSQWYSWTNSAWAKVPGNPENPTDPRGPSLVQYTIYNSPVCPASSPHCVPQLTLNSTTTFSKTTTKGNAIWVSATVSDFVGAHEITVTDSQNNTYHELGQVNDHAPGWQSVAQFYAGNIQGGANTITVHWSGDNYKGIVAAELAGVRASPLLGSAVDVQDGHFASGANNLNDGNISVSSGGTTELIVSLAMDTDGGDSDLGGTGHCAVAPGTGFTKVVELWNWSATGLPACNLATLETKTVTGADRVSGPFTTTAVNDPYDSVTAIFH